MKNSKLPLAGLRVIELGQLIAAPFAGFILGCFGAEVIKIEPPQGGDPMRGWRKMHKDTSLWWYTIARNKKSVTLNLRVKKAQDILKELIAKDTDILIENFRPGRMEEWGLGYKDLKKINPKLIMVRVSGWGQDGPYAKRPGFASVAEAIGGLRYTTGEPGRAPVRTGLSIGDSLAGVHAALGALVAVYSRDVNGGKGQVVDTAIYESVFNMLESTLPEYDLLGHVRERSGAQLPGIVPSNTYLCKDKKYLIIGGNNDSIFKRLMSSIGREDMANDQRFAQNPGRSKHEKEIDLAIQEWAATVNYQEAFELLDNAEVPVGPIYSIEDIAKDPQYQARKMFENVILPDGTPLKIPAVVPKLSETPGATQWVGPKLGEHNAEILGGVLGYGQQQLEELRAQGII